LDLEVKRFANLGPDLRLLGIGDSVLVEGLTEPSGDEAVPASFLKELEYLQTGLLTNVLAFDFKDTLKIDFNLLPLEVLPSASEVSSDHAMSNMTSHLGGVQLGNLDDSR
jgi:hypothetical protein